MHHISEQALLCHIERCHFEEIVTAIFQHHAMAASLFGRIYQIPALSYGHCRRYFHGDMFSLFHGIDSHRSMRVPIGANVDQIYVVPSAHLFPDVLTYINIGGRKFVRSKYFIRFVYIRRIQITQSDNFGIGQIDIPFDRTFTSGTQSDKTDSHRIQRLASQLQNTFLSGRPRRFFKRITWCRSTSTTQQKRRQRIEHFLLHGNIF